MGFPPPAGLKRVADEEELGNAAGDLLTATTGGFAATDIAALVVAGGDATAAIHQWLTETGRIYPVAHITHLEIRTWRPR